MISNDFSTPLRASVCVYHKECRIHFTLVCADKEFDLLRAVHLVSK